MKNTIAKKTEGYGYKYTELADINKYCAENGITYYQEVETNEINQKDYIITYLVKNIAHIEKEKTIVDEVITKHRGCQIVEAKLSGINNPVQQYGSSLTYCRRYSLLMALGLATEDDDGASLTEIKEATIEDANKWTFQFGKYKGQTMNEILDEDEQYVEWFINNKANDFDKKCYELLTGEILPTEEQLKERTKLSAQISKLMIDKKVLPNEISEHFGKSSKEMSDEDLEEVIKWLEEK